MKASHRKDVIIARLIFAAICLFLIALIVTIVITVNSKGGKKKEQDKVQQNAVSESETDSAGDRRHISATADYRGYRKNLRHYYKQCKHEREA